MTESFINDLYLSLPLPVLAVGILLVVLLGKKHSALISFIALSASALSAEMLISQKVELFNELLIVSGVTILIWKISLWIGALIALISSFSNIGEENGHTQEYFILLLSSILGCLVFVASNELITMFFALELLSLPLYCLCGSNLFRKQSTEAALKYFILGSFSSAFFLLGVSIFYGLYGSTYISSDLITYNSPLHIFSVGLIVLGILFKIGAAPLHYWVPDVYEGSPSPVTMYMSTIVKVSAVGALLLLLSGSIVNNADLLSRLLWMMSLLSMFVGSVGALRQQSLKRLLAYSSISHVGYILIPFIGFRGGIVEEVLFYVFGYVIVSLGLFAFIIPFGDKDSIHRLVGLGKRKPIVALSIALLLLSLAGLPPGLLGFFGKFKLFAAGIEAGYTGLIIAAVLSSVISLYYYLKIITYMFLQESNDDQHPDASLSSLIGVFISLIVLTLGLFPSLLLEWIKAYL